MLLWGHQPGSLPVQAPVIFRPPTGGFFLGALRYARSHERA